MTDATNNTDSDQVTETTLEGGSYDLIKRRLLNFGTDLKTQIDSANQARIDAFGSTELKVKGRVRVRTENNCIPRDIICIGDTLIFAFNVFIGLKTTTSIKDVFSLHKLTTQEDHFEVEDIPSEGSFLADSRFETDFNELYTYYKKAQLQHLYKQGSKLFAVFQIGERIKDIRVFRWSISSDNQVTYIDNRGERDIKPPQNHDFSWIETSRKEHEEGRHPHINILDKLFVETLNGSLTIKVENNTDSGKGIYSEAVEDKNQSLADCELEYAEVGALILLKVLPYREKQWRYFIFNCDSQQILRQDAIGDACVQLPEDHGIIYPGGYYLQTGQTRYFEDKADDLEFHRQIKSPNGEDVLFVFYEPKEGRYALFPYNLIDKNLQNPIFGHGYSLFDDGTTVTFKAENEEADRVHPVQIWQSPFVSAEFAANAPQDTSLLGKIGNPDLVRGISDLYSLHKLINEQSPKVHHYEAMIALSRNLFDRYHWLNESFFKAIETSLHSIFETSEQVLDEFEKVTEIQNKALTALSETQKEFEQLNSQIRPDSFKLASEFVSQLTNLKQLKGKLISLEELKYMDLQALKEITEQVEEKTLALSQATAKFLQQDSALAPYHNSLKDIETQTKSCTSVTELKQYIATLDELSDGLDLLNHTMLDLEIDDSRVRTKILEDISTVYGLVNRAKASVEIQRKSLGSVEAKAEFSARFKLLSQSITGALNNAKTPEECDEQLSRLLIQLEELESQFSEYDEFLADILSKRDDIYESFEKHKQSLIDARQRRALNLASAAERILQGITRRSQTFTELTDLNTYFSSDPMIGKLRSLVEELKSLDDQVKADDLQAKLKACKDQGIRSLRDKLDIYSDGGNTVAIGKHQFSVNKQKLDLTLLPRDGELTLHLTGSDYFEAISDAKHKSALDKNKNLWDQSLISESADIYRAEYLAACILAEVESPESEITLEQLFEAQKQNSLVKLVQKFAEPRYQEGYEKGIHDHDASIILSSLLSQKAEQGLLVYPAETRALACIFWVEQNQEYQKDIIQNAQNAALMQQHFSDPGFLTTLNHQIAEDISQYAEANPKLIETRLACNLSISAQYLVAELARSDVKPDSQQHAFLISQQGKTLADNFKQAVKVKNIYTQLQSADKQLNTLVARWQLYLNWLYAFNQQSEQVLDTSLVIEAACYLMLNERNTLDYQILNITSTSQVSGLMGQHPRINEQNLTVNYAEFFARTRDYQQTQVPAFDQYHKLRTEILNSETERLQLDEFKARPLSSFVRNQLIDKVYFPIIGDNLAKQIGAAGNNKRTDLMGMLLLISPPGYGKTTLIEYIANRLGLTFVKVNSPSIGHDQVSLDPAQAINATAEKEIEKINQSFEMGNNVMLYLDDIQHTNPEFLQKFISLCDGSRRIDGVWKGKSKTYDLRGKKFAVVMAGNPYTESGESFQIPDMLSNRADIYNLGDTLSGCEAEFAMSFIENALTSNSVLAPLANRNMQDLYKLIRICQGEDISLNELEHGYSQGEANEIKSVLNKLMVIRDTVLKVNAQYIASAAQDDKYRTEPPFKLQGSYRNMNKMAEKVVSVMNDEELENLIQDHYQGEAQTLSKGSEENTLKLAELRGNLTDEQAERFTAIKEDFTRLNRLDGAGSPAMLAVNQMSLLHEALESISGKLDKDTLSWDHSEQFTALTKATSANNNINLLSDLVQAVSGNNTTEHLAELSKTISGNNNHEQLAELSKVISGNNTTGHLAELVKTIAGNNTNAQLNDLTKVISTLDNKAVLAELTQTINANNSTEQLADIAKSIAENNASAELGNLTNAVVANNTSEQLTEIAQATTENNTSQILTGLNKSIEKLDNKAELNKLIQANIALNDTLQQQLKEQQVPEVNIDNHTDPQVADAVQAIAQTIDTSLIPVLKIMHHKIRLDHDVWNKVDAISKKLKQLDPAFVEPETPLTKHDEEILTHKDD